MSQPDSARLNRLERFALAIVCVLLFPLAVLTYNHLTEDAFITFRYVDQIAGGFGPVFNRGEIVEGYSNPLWTFLLVPIAWTPVRLHVAARLLSVAFLALLVAASGILGRRWLATHRPQAPRLAVWWLVAATALQPFLNYHRDLGLETVSYAALAGVMLFAAGNACWTLAGVVACGVALSRPEGLGFVLALAPLPFIAAGQASTFARERLRAAALLLAPPIAVFVAHLLARRVYYDNWVPNTVTAKSGASGGWRPLLTLLGSWWGFPLIAVAGATWRVVVERRCILAWGVLSTLLAVTVFQLQAGGIYQIGLRYLAPAVFPSLLGVWLLLVELHRVLATSGRSTIASGVAGILLVLNFHLPFTWSNPFIRGIPNDDPNMRLSVRLFQFAKRGDLADRVAWYLSDPIEINAQAGKWLAREFIPRHPDAVLAADQMGMLGYYLPHETHVVDMLGLMDRHVATYKLSGPALGAYLIERKVRFVVLHSYVDREVPPWIVGDMVGRASIPGLRATVEEPPLGDQIAPWLVLRPANNVEVFRFVVYGPREGAPATPRDVVLGVDDAEFLRLWRVTPPEDVPKMIFE